MKNRVKDGYADDAEGQTNTDKKKKRENWVHAFNMGIFIDA